MVKYTILFAAAYIKYKDQTSTDLRNLTQQARPPPTPTPHKNHSKIWEKNKKKATQKKNKQSKVTSFLLLFYFIFTFASASNQLNYINECIITVQYTIIKVHL